MPYANNKGADQPAHPRSLISAFVVRCLDSTSIGFHKNLGSSFQLNSAVGQSSNRLVISRLEGKYIIKLNIMTALITVKRITLVGCIHVCGRGEVFNGGKLLFLVTPKLSQFIFITLTLRSNSFT